MFWITPEQSLAAMRRRFYDGVEWTPEEGDFYTTTRGDCELYQVVYVQDGVVRTSYLNEIRQPEGDVSEWPIEEFTSEGFGVNRVHVPGFVLDDGISEQVHAVRDEYEFNVYLLATHDVLFKDDTSHPDFEPIQQRLFHAFKAGLALGGT